MKYLFRVSMLSVIGLATAVFIYPFLHELGHIIAIVISGFHVSAVGLFPFPYVGCNDIASDSPYIIAISLSGMITPFIVVACINFKNIWVRMTCFFLKGICTLSFALSAAAAIFYKSYEIWQNDDIVKVIEISKLGNTPWLLLMLCLFSVSLANMICEKPLNKLYYFLIS